MKVTQIIRHPKYNESLSAEGGGDIALLRLNAPVTLSEDIYPVSLPEASQNVSSGKTCWVTGWGDIRFKGKDWGDFMAILCPLLGTGVPPS